MPAKSIIIPQVYGYLAAGLNSFLVDGVVEDVELQLLADCSGIDANTCTTFLPPGGGQQYRTSITANWIDANNNTVIVTNLNWGQMVDVFASGGDVNVITWSSDNNIVTHLVPQGKGLTFKCLASWNDANNHSSGVGNQIRLI